MARFFILASLLCSVFYSPCAFGQNTPPVYLKDMNNFRISEGTVPGITVYNLTARDAETDVYYGIDKTDVFYADPVTGEVKLIRPLDYETSPILHFVTVVEDLPFNGSAANIISRSVAVYVTDINDNDPYFLNAQPIDAFIAPDTPSGSAVTILKAVDPDTAGEPLTISCKSILINNQDVCDFFTIRLNYAANATNTVSAELALASSTSQLYSLNVKDFDLTLVVSDGLHTADVRVHVALIGNAGAEGLQISRKSTTPFPMPPSFLEEDQHSSPDLHFDPPVGVVEISENWPASFPLPFRPKLINKTNGTITLTLRELSPSGLSGAFSLEPTSMDESGFIEIIPLRADVMDREKYPTDLHLEVDTYNAIAGISAVLPITIRLLDANDNAPVFRRESYNFTLTDDAEDDQHIGTAEATDSDSGQFGVEGLTYAILGPWAKYFRPVVRRSDIVEIRTAIPKVTSFAGESKPWRQLPETFVLILRVTDTNGTGLFTDAPVTVRVIRAEKHAPLFAQGVHFARLRERSMQLEPPLVLQAYDEDGSPLEYTLDDPTGHVFGIDTRTGVIYVQHPEDVSRTNLGPRLQLVALVSDGVHPPAKTNVTIDIIAVDEKKSNRAPKFKTPSYNFVMPAGASDGFVIGNVIAEDPEGTSVRYHLAGGGEDNFLLNEDTGELSFNGARLLKDQTFVLTVLASDSAIPPGFSSVQLRIIAKGLSTVESKFTDTVYTAYVSENATEGTELVNLKVIDPDANGLYSFSVRRAIAFDLQGYPVLVAADGTDLSAYFAFRETHMILRKSLYEIDLSTFHIQISANDLLHPLEQAAYTFVVLNVIPVTKPFLNTIDFVGVPVSREPLAPVVVETTVPSDIETGGFIYRFHVIEKPATAGVIKPAQVSFRLLNNSEFYAIDQATGIVSATKSLSKAPERSILVIEAGTTRPGRIRNAKLTVRVVKPVRVAFAMRTSHFDIRIPEDTRRGNFVLHANTTAVDSASVRYNLTGPDAEAFSVDEQGVVTLATELDREKINALAFVVEAALVSENGSVVGLAVAPVAVTVLDVNDNAPAFENETYTAVILENTPINSYILHFRATDFDAGENGIVVYRLANMPQDISGYITIDQQEGILLNNRLLIGHAGTYRFLATAVDGGGLNSSVTVNLIIQPISHCQPIWSRPDENSTILEIQENLSPGQLVGMVRAVTEDEKCKVKYTFLDSSTGQATGFTNEFELDSDSGKIMTKTMLDREKKARYTLTVNAKDSEIGSVFTVQTVVEIIVKDVNDNDPMFEPPTGAEIDCDNVGDFAECWSSRAPRMYNFSIFENEPPGTVLGLLKAVDADEGDNAKVYYHLAGGRDASKFVLDSKSGRLSTKESLDYENVHEIEAVVVSTNSAQLNFSEKALLLANTSAINVALVNVQVLDRNDHGPMFDKIVYLAAIANETIPETLVVLVHAIDPDTTGGGVYYRMRKITYHYKGSDIMEQGLFAVDSVEGEVRTLRQVGQYSQGYFQLTIDSSNAQNYTSNLSDTTNVKIWIYNPEQLVRIVIKDSPINITDHADTVVRELGNAIGADVILQRIEYNRNALGVISSDRVDLLAVFIDRSTEEIMEIARVLSVVDRQGLLLTAASRPDLGVVQILPAQSLKDKSTMRLSAAAIALIVFGCVMFIGLLGFLLLLCYFRYSFIKDVKTAVVKKPEPPKLTQQAFVVSRRMKENPLWNEVEKKPYEEQELSMPMSTDNGPDASMPPRAVVPKQQPNTDGTFRGSAVMDATQPYARIYKQQPSNGGSVRTISDNGDDYYQTLRMN